MSDGKKTSSIGSDCRFGMPRRLQKRADWRTSSEHLPRDLIALGLDVRVMIPYHSIIKKKYGEKTKHLTDFWIHLGWRSHMSAWKNSSMTV